MVVRGQILLQIVGSLLLVAGTGRLEASGGPYFRGLLEECEPRHWSSPVVLGHYYPHPPPPQVLRELEPLAPVYVSPPDGGVSHWKPWKGTNLNLEAPPVSDPPAPARGWEYDQRVPCYW
jgi:hypothetical protein